MPASLDISNTFSYGITVMQKFITTITQKSQITLSKEIRQELGLHTKDRVELTVVNQRLRIKKIGSMLDLAGSIKPPSGKSALKARTEMAKSYERF
jgi:AbrB family looped-hinge helix DNA binding protein